MTAPASRRQAASAAGLLLGLLAMCLAFFLAAPGKAPGPGATPDPLAGLMDKLRANPGDAGILIQVGEEYMAAGDWERAAPFLRQAAQGGTPDARALSLLGICLFRQGRPEEAAESFEQALRLREDPIALYNLAILHRYHLNRPEPAEGLLRRALQSPESDADLLERVRRELGTN